ncbi:hypothetical protein BJ170DRAFT_604395 [Xylariales sp. AK1849]|nr:hypothetical protein BJ170DRAFT_604395 [Xylariales sp. AK1849]
MTTTNPKGPEPHILLLATCDTKMEEIAFVHTQLTSLNPTSRLTLIDIGRMPKSNDLITLSLSEILQTASEAGVADTDLVSNSRGEYSARMIEAAISYVRIMKDQEPLHGVIGIGGSTGSSIIAAIMRDAVPIGLPKLLVSTMVSGDVGHFVGGVDMTLMYSVVDIAGLNFLSERVLANATAAISAMAASYATSQEGSEPGEKEKNMESKRKQRVAITMFGVTTPGVDYIRDILTQPPHNAEVVVFHATGSGGRAMETIVGQKAFDAVIDLTTTEIADEVGGGILSAGPDRLSAGVAAGVPMIVSVGACDMINFGPLDTMKAEILEACEKGDRKLHVHNPSVTLLRTTKEENRHIAEFIVEKLGKAKRKDLIRVLLPTESLSMLSGKGGPFEDREADAELFCGVEHGLKGSGIDVVKVGHGINDREFAERVVDALAVVRDSL